MNDCKIIHLTEDDSVEIMLIELFSKRNNLHVNEVMKLLRAEYLKENNTELMGVYEWVYEKLHNQPYFVNTERMFEKSGIKSVWNIDRSYGFIYKDSPVEYLPETSKHSRQTNFSFKQNLQIKNKTLIEANHSTESRPLASKM